MKNIIKKIIGFDKIESEISKAVEAKQSLESEAAKLIKSIELAKEIKEKTIQEIHEIKSEAEAAKLEAEAAKLEAEKILKEETEKRRQAKLSPKDLATEKKEPYFNIINFQLNPENPRFGFWELDWNEYKVLELKALGYFGETDEEVIDQWFSEILRISGNQMGFNLNQRVSGFINVNKLSGGLSEIS